MKNYYQMQTKVQCNNNIIPNPKMTKFLGLIIDDTLTWNQHIEYTATKLCSACYALRNLKHIVPKSTLRTLCAYIHPIISYGIIFWGRSAKVTKLFILQKCIVRVLSNTRARETCRDAFRKMEILMLYSQYLYSLIVFTVENKHSFTLNKDIHTHTTRYNSNIHLSTVNLTKYHKGPYISGGKAFNHLPLSIQNLAEDLKAFKVALKKFLYRHSFYSIEEYYEHNVKF